MACKAGCVDNSDIIVYDYYDKTVERVRAE